MSDAKWATCRKCGETWYEKRDLKTMDQCPYCKEWNTKGERIIIKASPNQHTYNPLYSYNPAAPSKPRRKKK